MNGQMGESYSERTVRWLFGTEGVVALRPEMGVVMAMTAIGVSGIFVVSPIVNQLSGPFGVPEARVGQLITAFVAPSILLVPVMGALADRIGRRAVIVGGLVVIGVAGPAVGLTSSFTVALGLRAIQGIGYAAVIPVGAVLIGDLYEGSREATAQGLRVASIQTTNLVSPPLAGVLVLASWRFPFFLYALALVVAVVAWRTLPPAEHEGSDGLGQYARDLLALVSEPVLAMVMLSFMIRFLLTFSFFAYVSVLLSRTIDASAVLTGVIVSLFALVSLVSAAQAGRLAEAWDMLLVTLVGILLSGIGMVVMGLFPTVPVIVIGVVLGGIGAGIAGPLQKSLVTQLAPAPLRAGALSSAVIFQSIGSAGGPLLMGIALGTLTVTTTFVVFGFGGAAAGLGVLGVAYLKAAPGQYGR
jgi:predicted MFS family arabinose efflux permease